MKHHACIAIGINQYQSVQPLNYAQEDAEALHRFLVGEMAFDPARCLLMTDSSPPIGGQLTTPTRQNISEQVERLCQEKLKPGDTLWCFFSGYGITHQGHEYLLPVDGDPQKVETTAISVRSLFTTLKMAQVETVLVLLDINRNQGAKAGEHLGEKTMEVAGQLEIPTILSCRPNQVSREASALRHGFFTAALLEALTTGHGKTLRSLSQFLSERLPELSDHHLRPKQDPMVVVHPLHRLDQHLLPLGTEMMVAAGVERNGEGVAGEKLNASNSRMVTPIVSVPVDPAPKPEVNGSYAETNGTNGSGASVPMNGTNGSGTQGAMNGTNGSGAPVAMNDANGSGAQPVSTVEDETASLSTAEIPREESKIPVPPPDQSPKETMSEKPFLPQLIAWTGGIAALLLLGVIFTNKSVFWGESSGNSTSTEVTQSLPVKSEETAPAPETAAKPETAPATTEPSTPTQGGVGEKLLNQAQTRIQENSASRFSDAIGLASQIPANDPRYAEAQMMIERWNQTILDIANGRASQGNYQGAVAAATLVTPKSPKIYQQAQNNMASWQQQVKLKEANQTLLNTAKKQINRGEASSYSNAIGQVSTIQPGQPLYDEAQELIDSWSNTILSIAQLRARRGEYGDAIAAATLVPATTTYYELAQKSITEWQQKLESQKKAADSRKKS